VTLLLRLAASAALIVAVVVLGPVCPARAEQPTPIVRTADPAALAGSFANCLSAENEGRTGKEVVLLQDRVVCAEYRTGSKLVTDNLQATTLDPKTICRPDQNDQRKLRSSIVSEVAKTVLNQGSHIGSRGIRIIGAIFCSNEVDLSNTNLPYPLILDYGVFTFGIRAQNLHVGGNFSVDGSLIFDNLALDNSQIDGSIYGRRSFIQNLHLVDTEVRGSANFNASILFASTSFDRFTLHGDLDLDESALSYLIVRRSKIAGQLDLSDTEARCGYRVTKSEIGDLLVRSAGFGKTVSSDTSQDAALRTWARNMNDETFKPLNENPAISRLISKPDSCADEDEIEFFFAEDTIGSLCLQSFHWLTSHDARPPATTLITFANVVVTGDMYVDLWPHALDRVDPISATTQKLQLMGTKAAFFVLNFQDNERPYATFVDRVQFDRVNGAEIDCDAEPRAANWHIPSTGEVEKWLDKNTAPGKLLPIATFAEAAQRAGVDATDLKVDKAWADLWSNISAKRHEFAAVMVSGDSRLTLNYIFSLDRLIDWFGLSLTFIGGAVADFGFRPYKSIIYIGAAVLLGYVAIVKLLKVTHAKSEVDNREFRIGPYFIFDRMIPGYNFEPAHFKIQQFFFSDDQPIDETTKKRLNWILTGIKLFGILAAVCIAASLKSLFPTGYEGLR
jgi:hypothetical protein